MKKFASNWGNLMFLKKSFWFIIAFCITSCASPREITNDLVIYAAVKQDGRSVRRVCGVNVGCGKLHPLECIGAMHEIVQVHMRAASFFIQGQADRGQIISEFITSLCKLKDIEREMMDLKIRDFQTWKIIFDTGFVDQINMLITVTSMEIFEPPKVKPKKPSDSI